jgi:serine/threonine protein kinase
LTARDDEGRSFSTAGDGYRSAMDAADGAPAPPAVRVLAGRYEVGAVIGRGGMGEVRAGLDRRLDRAVAIKLLRADMAHQPEVRQRFEDEARLAARLAHPNVVAVFDTGEEAGVPYLVMERLPGRTLADEIEAGPLDCDAVRTAGLQILDALKAAHAAGLVHRDVKPGNVLVCEPGWWKVGDFGIAKSLDVSDPTLTVAGVVLGTPAYLAPERLRGGPATVASDLYATGVVLYEALAGCRPVGEDVPLAARPTATPTELTDVRPDVPSSLANVVMRAIASDPAQRYATADEMANALRLSSGAISGAETVALAGRPSASTTRVTPTISPTVQVPSFRWTPPPGDDLSFNPRRNARRRTGVITIAVAAVLVAAIVAVAMAVVDNATSTATPPPTTATPSTTALPSPPGGAGSGLTSVPPPPDSTTIAAGGKHGHAHKAG